MSKNRLPYKRIKLISAMALTVIMHFFLPYAALAQHLAKEPHAPPPKPQKQHEHHDEHSLHEELPPHIEAEENELEEISEEEFARDLSHQQHPGQEKTPRKAVFVYPDKTWQYQLKTGIPADSGHRIALNQKRSQ